MRLITKIVEFFDRRADDIIPSTTSGYAIHTKYGRAEPVVYLAIDSYQSCCENWGYFMSNDDLEYFVGAELLKVKITSTAKDTTIIGLDNRINGYLDGGDVMFVDLETNRGVLQFTAYNAHNGYYGHSAYIISSELNVRKEL